jgi:adenylylsulfate kinase-like enzyme
VAKLCNDIGLITIVALVSPYEADRADARSIIGPADFFEVFVDAPLEVCEKRDDDGLYKAARIGTIRRFTGVSAPYEAPGSPDLHIDSTRSSIEESVQKIIDLLKSRGSLQ